jgi:hypothetical protein
MPSREETVQARLRAVTLPVPNGMYNEDWHAYLNFKLIPAGQLVERQIALYLTLLPGARVTGSVAQNYFLQNPTLIPA